MAEANASPTFTHFSPCSTRDTALQPRLCCLGYDRCILPDCASHKLNRNIPAVKKGSMINDSPPNLSHTIKVQGFQLTPLRHTWVPELQEVKFSFGSEAGHRAVAPLHMPSLAHSESSLHFSVVPLNVHSAVQHGPWLGLEHYNHKSETQGFKPDWHQNLRGEYFTKSHDGPADFIILQSAPFALRFVGTIAAHIFALVTVAAVALLSTFHQPITANRLSGLCKHTGATPWRGNLSSSARRETKKAYQQNNRLFFFVERH